MIKKKEEVKKGRHSRVFSGAQRSGISLLYVVCQIRKKLPCFTKAGKAGDPRLRHSGMTPSFSKAFTLIELLVVVLIIGILAAVALPQYQKAVDKSRLTQVLIRMKDMSKAAELYVLENGFPSSTVDLFEIDPDLQAGLAVHSSEYYKDKFSVYHAICYSNACHIRASYNKNSATLRQDVSETSIVLERFLSESTGKWVNESCSYPLDNAYFASLCNLEGYTPTPSLY